MQLLKDRIRKDGTIKEGNVLKVDSFLNHQMDIALINEMGKEFRRRFPDESINKILTIEASGIGIACITAQSPGKTLADKYFIGFYDGETLAAMMDLITGYPNPATAFIGLFMVDAAQQGRGTGSALIADCKRALRAEQFKTLRLAIDEGNPQSKAFWQKNGFALTGQCTPNENGAYLPMECEL